MEDSGDVRCARSFSRLRIWRRVVCVGLYLWGVCMSLCHSTDMCGKAVPPVVLRAVCLVRAMSMQVWSGLSLQRGHGKSVFISESNALIDFAWSRVNQQRNSAQPRMYIRQGSPPHDLSLPLALLRSPHTTHLSKLSTCLAVERVER